MTEENIAIAFFIFLMVVIVGFFGVYLPVTAIRSDPDWEEKREKKKRTRRTAAARH